MSSSDNFRMDSHKLLYHPRRVSDWLDGSSIYPLYMEISPSGACNHRCVFCAKDYIGYLPRFLDTAALLASLPELSAGGVRSIMYGGEGEPLLHPDISDIIRTTAALDIDVALSTNGVKLLPELSEKILPELSWIRVSINAGTPDRYAAIHSTRAGDFDAVLENIRAAARIIKASGLRCTLGTQSLLLPENADDMETLAELVKNAGADYLAIKPYSQHHSSTTRRYADIDYSAMMALDERLARFNSDTFRVIFRSGTMRKMSRSNRGYERCLALPFWSYIDSGGNVWGCSSFIGDDRFCYGNIQEESFAAIWQGERRRQSLRYVAEQLDPEQCRMNCRMDEVNHYLWELTHPGPHVNFI